MNVSRKYSKSNGSLIPNQDHLTKTNLEQFAFYNKDIKDRVTFAILEFKNYSEDLFIYFHFYL